MGLQKSIELLKKEFPSWKELPSYSQDEAYFSKGIFSAKILACDEDKGSDLFMRHVERKHDGFSQVRFNGKTKILQLYYFKT